MPASSGSSPKTIIKTDAIYISRTDFAALHADYKTTIDGDPWVLRRSEVTGATELRRAEVVADVSAVDVAPDPVVAETIRLVVEQLPDTLAVRAFFFDPRRPGWVRIVLPGLQRSMTVSYVHGLDHYDVVVCDTTNSLAVTHRVSFERIYTDQLGPLLARPRAGTEHELFEPVPITLEVRVTDWPTDPAVES